MTILVLLLRHKFKRDGIDVQMACRVVSVSNKEITMKVKSKRESLYNMCWLCGLLVLGLVQLRGT
ncbi:hypothetical protein PRUPE_3G132100 [Prunus persica]|uniref:Uncharacterized protein n=1 Tax=Prunus persica TaxID=3760 RepID=A0A251PZF9_PRUPE|nr:hypothetical protein PRUPE_3G132100 [Prunus persica]ONI16967.1 hypothetical protein PRUPE_3G132100 [Prunus persica]ONI16968.1 hypothetical protein PRUPE_3G132100 [Prunus persica]